MQLFKHSSQSSNVPFLIRYILVRSFKVQRSLCWRRLGTCRWPICHGVHAAQWCLVLPAQGLKLPQRVKCGAWSRICSPFTLCMSDFLFQGRTEFSTLPFASRASWDLASVPPLRVPRPLLRFSLPTTSSPLSTRCKDPHPLNTLPIIT